MEWTSRFVFVIGRENEERDIGGKGLWAFRGIFLAFNLRWRRFWLW